MKAVVTVPFSAGPNKEHGLDKRKDFMVDDIIEGDLARLMVGQKKALEMTDLPEGPRLTVRVKKAKDAAPGG